MNLRLETSTGDVLVVAGERIAPPETTPDRILRVEGQLHRGLINAHDHLHRNHYPRLGLPPYEDAYAWGTDLHVRYQQELERARSIDRRTALLFGAFKNIVAGATTVVHHDVWEPDFDHAFPLHVAHVRTAHSPGFERDWDAVRAAAHAHPELPLCVHLAEGVNQRAAGEVSELDELGFVDGKLLAVHCVGVEQAGIARLLGARAALVWCPTSNHFLFGRTAPAALLRSGLDVLLGSDALLTGQGTLLDELRFARTAGVVDDAVLLAAVGASATRRLGLAAPGLEPGARADVIVLRKPILEARAADLALVMVAGRIVLANDAIEDALAEPSEQLVIGGVPKRVPVALAAAVQEVVELTPECARILE